jgi:hypothetical protein
MTRDDIIKMAKEAGFNPVSYTGANLELFERFAALVAAHEREACAKVCDEKVDAEYKTGKVDHNEMGWTQACAIAIRARGER